MTAAPARYPIPAGTSRVEDEVKKSRFITTVAHAPTVDAARSFVQSLRDEFPDATHNCWAYVVGAPGSTRENGAGDDGEPAGSAGRPMLGALLNSGVGDVAVVVTRYFGGTKLGRGGLARAYARCVLHALRELVLDEHVDRVHVDIAIPYASVDAARRALAARGARIEEEAYGEEATLRATLPAHEVEALAAALADATGGAARIAVACPPGD